MSEHGFLPAKRPTRPRDRRVYVSRLGRHHFAYLRCVAEGLPLVPCAQRYLGIEHGHEAVTAHRQVVDAVRAIARRHNEPAWRLIGLTIVEPTATSQPTLEDFIAERDLDGWSETEVQEMYREAYPDHPKSDRRQRLRLRQFELLRRIEQLAAETPSPSDLVAGWFDDRLAQRIVGAGMLTLGDLNRAIATGGRWYRGMPGVGEAKAKRIESHLATLLAREVAPAKPWFTLEVTPSLFAPVPQNALRASGSQALTALHYSDVIGPTLPSSNAAVGVVASAALIDARNDFEATEAWVKARAGSVPTATVYRREARRFLLWLQYERFGKTLSQVNVDDCADFMAFLQNIPQGWISRERAAPGQPGWAPFRGPLSHKSQQQTVVIVASLFAWLLSARYVASNPWPLINTKTGDDRSARMLDTKALSEGATKEVLSFVQSQPPSPSQQRILFILRFVEAVGLRSAELLAARLEDFRLEPEGWLMQIHGKGSKNRIAAVPGQAFEALQDYLEARHLGGIETAPPHAPLLASTLDAMESVGYQALYEHVKSWISKAVSASALPTNERLKLAGATTHWLRHTFGTRAVAREVPLDVVQAQMGHASIQTTMSIYGRAPIKRRINELAKAFK